MTPEELVRQIIDSHLDKRGFALDALLVDDLGADSLDLVQMILVIEESEGMEEKIIPVHLLDGVKTVGEFIKLVTPYIPQENEHGHKEASD